MRLTTFQTVTASIYMFKMQSYNMIKYLYIISENINICIPNPVLTAPVPSYKTTCYTDSVIYIIFIICQKLKAESSSLKAVSRRQKAVQPLHGLRLLAGCPAINTSCYCGIEIIQDFQKPVQQHQTKKGLHSENRSDFMIRIKQCRWIRKHPYHLFEFRCF